MHPQNKETKTLSRRAVLQAAGGGAALAAALLAKGLTSGVAQAGNQPSLIGAWNCRDVPAAGPPRVFLSIYSADGSFMLVPSNPLRSIAVGAWTRIADRQFAVTDRRYRYDEELRLDSTGKVSATVTLDEAGDSFTGRSVTEFYDLEGNIVSTGGGAFTGTRIVAERL